MTAYALMTFVLLAQDDASLIGEAMPIVRWLTKQRNALGGFSSTQVCNVLFFMFLCNYFATVNALFLSASNSLNAAKCAAHLGSSHFNVICALQEQWRTATWIQCVKQRLFVFPNLISCRKHFVQKVK